MLTIIPAIDIKDGRCVRLFQGEMDKETVYFDRPLDAARHWAEQGAKILHIVDLNGAIQGRPVHTREIEMICREAGLAVELGGGLRSLEAVRAALDLGAARAVIGTAAYDDPKLLRALCESLPRKIVIAIDARDGKVAVKGWKETTSMDAVELARRCASDGASRIIYTDIARDGTRSGVNTEETRKIAQAVNLPVIASGGVATLEDIRRLLPLESEGVEGVIIGRALYSGVFTLKEAMRVAADSGA